MYAVNGHLSLAELNELELRFDGPIPAQLKPGYVAPVMVSEVDRLTADLRVLEAQLANAPSWDRDRCALMVECQKRRIAAQAAPIQLAAE